MKKKIIFLLFLMSVFFLQISGQCVLPDNLIYKKSHYYLQGKKSIYTGCVSGYVHNYNFNLGGLTVLFCEVLNFNLNHGDSINSNYDTSLNIVIFAPIHVEGMLYKGIEIGDWILHNRDSTVVGYFNFDKASEQVELSIFFNGKLVADGIIPYSEIDCKDMYRKKLRHY